MAGGGAEGGRWWRGSRGSRRVDWTTRKIRWPVDRAVGEEKWDSREREGGNEIRERDLLKEIFLASVPLQLKR